MNRPLIILSRQEMPETLCAMEQAVVDHCRMAGLACWLVPPLYHVADSSDLWRKLSERPSENALLLGWIHPRPTQWLLRRHGVDVAGIAIFHLGSFADAAAALEAIGADTGSGPQVAAGGPSTVAERDNWPAALEPFGEVTQPRWFPVIDGARCVQCQHCLQFCLFGVYELDGQGLVVVQNPDRCKPGCPACARVCPQSAIMFPLHQRDAAIAGAPGALVVRDAAARRMYYVRTGRPCPVCGATAGSKQRAVAGEVPLCAECGGPQLAAASAEAAATPSTAGPSFDDLDDLVARLEQRMQGGDHRR
jgi:Pyruvate/2-oxoacid:ferredoxin oxidoreductase delta subunit